MEHAHGGHRQRLRDRYTQSGAAAFADHELLELLLTYAIPRRDVNDTAHALLLRFGSLENVLKASPTALQQVPGIGETAAVFLHLQHDVMQRILLQRFSDETGHIRLTTPLVSARYALELLHNQVTESAILICLNAQRVVLCVARIGDGTLAEAAVYPRTAAEMVLLHHAHSAILAHNHPSGSPLPSAADHETTEKVSAALSSLGVPLLDHLIVGRGSVYSSSSRQVVSFTGSEPVCCSAEEFQQFQTDSGRSLLSRVMEPYPETV